MIAMVIGDFITDEYVFGTAERICPEAPVPVIVPQSAKVTDGGAGLVSKQLSALVGVIRTAYGSLSVKRRIFVGNHLVCRIDRDSINAHPPEQFADYVISWMKEDRPEVLVISDYGKGSFNESSAKRIMEEAKALNIFVFVDAKHNWSWWDGAFAKFPNQREHHIVGTAEYIIFKLGGEGCSVSRNIKNIVHVPLEDKKEVKDVTGAGDVFLAAFVAHFIKESHDMVECAKFANKIASNSVEHLGTHIYLDKSV